MPARNRKTGQRRIDDVFARANAIGKDFGAFAEALQAFDQAPYQHLGVEPAAEKIVVVKSSVHFRAEFEPIAEEVILVAAPGHVVETGDLPYRRLRPGVRLTPMSNSGGSWGADGYLYLTGHDYPEIYVMRPPVTGGTLEWVATVHVPGLNGQGIAWDRTIAEPVLWGILKSRSEVYRIHMPKIDLPPKSQTGLIHQPADFAK